MELLTVPNAMALVKLSVKNVLVEAKPNVVVVSPGILDVKSVQVPAAKAKLNATIVPEMVNSYFSAIYPRSAVLLRMVIIHMLNVQIVMEPVKLILYAQVAPVKVK